MARSQPLLEKDSLHLLAAAVERLEHGFAGLPPADASLAHGDDVARVLDEVAARMSDNYPYFHPLYAGQMLKPPHPVARLAAALAVWINPNNHALDGGRASSRMEKEAVAGIARMFGWNAPLGHLTSGGTMANLEALWVAGRIHPGKKIVASSQAHYTHGRIGAVLGLEVETIPVTARGTHGRGRARAARRAGRRRHRGRDPRHHGGGHASIRFPRSSSSATSTGSASTSTRPTAATSASWTTCVPRRAPPMSGCARSTRS